VRTLRIAAFAGTLLAGAALAAGPTVYRCGPDGREYSQVPCKDGRVVDAADPRSAAQQREAKEVADSQARLAGQLEAERRQREAAAGGGAPAAAPARAAASAPPAQAKHSNKAAKAAASKDFTARAPAASAAAKR